ncbi:MAG: TMEM165/GDT1 family protein [Steroidobacteraceae bacterium]|jgi:putative Ca2+/H+ antiporter (TMEM165/GDT1 family)
MEAFLICASAIVLGEIGDRTQLLALILTTRLRRPLPIIFGILVATLANHMLAALFGQWAGSLLSARVLRWTLGISFLLLAAWVLVPDKADSGAPARGGGYGAFMLTVTTFFLAEMGDKTQIAAMALAARFRSLAVVVAGTTCGMMLVEVPTVLLAGRVTRVLPLRWIRLGAAIAYALLGALTLCGLAPLGF